MIQQKLNQIREQYNFNPQQWLDKKAQALNQYLQKYNLHGIVLSVSGGIDSTVSACICSYASQIENSPIKRIVLLQQPIHSTAKIVDRALELNKLKNVELIEIDQTQIYDQLKQLIDTKLNINGQSFASGNLRSYMRTPSAYYVAQLLNQSECSSVVLSTGNKDEDGYLYYFSKAGDGIGDICLIGDLHKHQVFQVAQLFNNILSQEILTATPSADLWEGQKDEDEIGCSYDFVELIMELYDQNQMDEFISQLQGEEKQIFLDAKEKVDQIHRRNSHKAKYNIQIGL